MSVGVQVDTKKLNEILAKIPGNRDAIVKAAAWHVLATARPRAPRVTGWLQDNSTVTNESAGTYNVEFNADYAAYVEMGTYKMGARPFLKPACEAERQLLIDRIKKDLIK